MEVLVIGKPSSLARGVIRTLNKENHRVSVLSGVGYSEKKDYGNIFELHNFMYDAICISDVFENIQPDIIIFLGVLENDVDRNILAYTSNLLVSYSALGHGRFIFVSTDRVFSSLDCEYVREDCSVYLPDGTEAELEESLWSHIKYEDSKEPSLLFQCEELCRSFRSLYELDIVIARMGGLYNVPKTKLDSLYNSHILDMCIKAVQDGEITISTDFYQSYLSEQDAIYFLLRLAIGDLQNSCYNITGWTLSDSKLAYMIENELKPYNRELKIRTETKSGGIVLDTHLFSSDIGINTLRPVSSDIANMIKNILNNEDEFMGIQSKRAWYEVILRGLPSLIIFLLPYIENIAVYGFIQYIKNKFVIDFSILYVIIFAMIYGQNQALVSIAACIIGPVLNSTGNSISPTDILNISLVGMSIGYLQESLLGERLDAKIKYSSLLDKYNNIIAINSSNLRVKKAFRTQLITHDRSIESIYKITSELDSIVEESVLFRAVKIISDLIGSREVCLYTITKTSQFMRLFTATSVNATKLGNTVQLSKDTLGAMYDSISKHTVFINKELDSNLPMMADALYQNDDLLCIIMIWDMNLDQLNIGEANIFHIICMLIRDSMSRALREMEMSRQNYYVRGFNILNEKSFIDRVKIYREAMKNRLTTYSLLLIEKDQDDLKSARLYETLPGLIRPTDNIGIYKGSLVVLLSNTTKDLAEAVRARLLKSGIHSHVMEDEIE